MSKPKHDNLNEDYEIISNANDDGGDEHDSSNAGDVGNNSNNLTPINDNNKKNNNENIDAKNKSQSGISTSLHDSLDDNTEQTPESKRLNKTVKNKQINNQVSAKSGNKLIVPTTVPAKRAVGSNPASAVQSDSIKSERSVCDPEYEVIDHKRIDLPELSGIMANKLKLLTNLKKKEAASLSSHSEKVPEAVTPVSNKIISETSNNSSEQSEVISEETNSNIPVIIKSKQLKTDKQETLQINLKIEVNDQRTKKAIVPTQSDEESEQENAASEKTTSARSSGSNDSEVALGESSITNLDDSENTPDGSLKAGVSPAIKSGKSTSERSNANEEGISDPANEDEDEQGEVDDGDDKGEDDADDNDDVEKEGEREEEEEEEEEGDEVAEPEPEQLPRKEKTPILEPAAQVARSPSDKLDSALLSSTGSQWGSMCVDGIITPGKQIDSSNLLAQLTTYSIPVLSTPVTKQDIDIENKPKVAKAEKSKKERKKKSRKSSKKSIKKRKKSKSKRKKLKSQRKTKSLKEKPQANIIDTEQPDHHKNETLPATKNAAVSNSELVTAVEDQSEFMNKLKELNITTTQMKAKPDETKTTAAKPKVHPQPESKTPDERYTKVKANKDNNVVEQSKQQKVTVTESKPTNKPRNMKIEVQHMAKKSATKSQYNDKLRESAKQQKTSKSKQKESKKKSKPKAKKAERDSKTKLQQANKFGNDAKESKSKEKELKHANKSKKISKAKSQHPSKQDAKLLIDIKEDVLLLQNLEKSKQKNLKPKSTTPKSKSKSGSSSQTQSLRSGRIKQPVPIKPLKKKNDKLNADHVDKGKLRRVRSVSFAKDLDKFQHTHKSNTGTKLTTKTNSKSPKGAKNLQQTSDPKSEGEERFDKFLQSLKKTKIKTAPKKLLKAPNVGDQDIFMTIATALRPRDVKLDGEDIPASKHHRQQRAKSLSGKERVGF